MEHGQTMLDAKIASLVHTCAMEHSMDLARPDLFGDADGILSCSARLSFFFKVRKMPPPPPRPGVRKSRLLCPSYPVLGELAKAADGVEKEAKRDPRGVALPSLCILSDLICTAGYGCGSKPMVPLSGTCTTHFSLF